MERNMDLVREILLAVEKDPHGNAKGNPEIDGYSEEQISYHIYLMAQAGLVEAAISKATMGIGRSSPDAQLLRMTWTGHEFMDAAREPERWSTAKKMMEKAGDGSFQVWLAVLGQLVMKSLGI